MCMKDIPKGAHGRALLYKKACMLTGADFWHSRGWEEEGIAPLRFADGPHGLRVQAGGTYNFDLKNSLPATCFPTLAALGCSWNGELVRAAGERLGEEAAYFGVNVLLGPGVNIKRNPLCGRNFEYLSEDAYLAGELAANYVRGVQSEGVACCVKHFCCNNREWARTVYSSNVSARALREIYLAPFEAAVRRGGASAVMTAYNKVNGTYCSQNGRLITDILRGEWGFDGIVVSDWVGTSDRAAGVRAGEDLEMPRCNFTPEEIVSAVERGELAEEDIDACIARLSRFAKKYARPAGAPFDGAEHSAFAARAATECAVLLKNDGMLPLKRGEGVAVIGGLAFEPHVQGGGSSHVNDAGVQNFIDCLKQKFDVSAERGYRTDGKYSKKLHSRALALAARTGRVIYFMGLTDTEDAEGADRATLALPECQVRLLREMHGAGAEITVVLCAGSAVDCGWDRYADAVLYMPLTGAGSGVAAASLLCGESVPSGKLAQTFPLSYADVPCGGDMTADAYGCDYAEDIFVGYRYYDAAGIAVKYPFGHGLSYTKFEYSGLACNDGQVSFKIKNTGSAGGAEVVQLYMSLPECGAAVAEKQLAAFKKVYLAAGEERTVTLVPDISALRVYCEGEGRFEVFGGEYGVKVGSSSRDIRLEGQMYIDGALPGEGNSAAERVRILSAARGNRAPAAENTENNAGRREKKEITLHSPLIDLKCARGAAGRLIYKLADIFCTASGQTAMLTFRYITVRSAMQYAGFCLARAHGFVDICNGRFFKGLIKLITGREKDK